jgi:hypothetical protein
MKKQPWEIELQNEIRANREIMDKNYEEKKLQILKFLDNYSGATVDAIFANSGLGELEFHHLMTRLLEEDFIEADDGLYCEYGIAELEGDME